MQTNEAFLEYESVRHRLPAVSEIGQCLHLSNLEDLIDQIDVFLLDAFGVLNIGNTAIEGVPERVSKLQSIGKRVIVVSNAGGFPNALLIAFIITAGAPPVPASPAPLAPIILLPELVVT